MTVRLVLGDTPTLRILDHFIENGATDYSKNEIQEHTGIRPVDLKRDFHCLVDCGILVETRKIGGTQLYRLDRENPLTQALLVFDDEITDHAIDHPIDEAVNEDYDVEQED